MTDFSREKCVRCGWTMGSPPLSCQNDGSPHSFPSQAVVAAERDQLIEQVTSGRAAEAELRSEWLLMKGERDRLLAAIRQIEKLTRSRTAEADIVKETV